MTAPAIDVRDHMSTALGVIDAGLGQWSAFRFGELEGQTLPHIYALVSVSRRFAPSDRNGRSGRSGWRLSVRYVGRSPVEAEWAESKVAAALDGVRLTVDGLTSTPVTHESTTAVEPDNGRFSGLSSWIYVL